MESRLNQIREPNKNSKMRKKIINTTLILILGITLGIFSKWLDNMSINQAIWWQHLLEITDLRNVFSSFGIWIGIAVSISVFSETPLRASLNVFLFFIGMNTSYHLYTVLFSGFHPTNYMIIWYVITFITPILSFFCWYAKGRGKIAFFLNVSILTGMLLSSFGIGMWYFDFKSILDTLLFLGTIGILYTNPKKSMYSVVGAFIFAFLLRIVI